MALLWVPRSCILHSGTSREILAWVRMARSWSGVIATEPRSQIRAQRRDESHLRIAKGGHTLAPNKRSNVSPFSLPVDLLAFGSIRDPVPGRKRRLGRPQRAPGGQAPVQRDRIQPEEAQDQGYDQAYSR